MEISDDAPPVGSPAAPVPGGRRDFSRGKGKLLLLAVCLVLLAEYFFVTNWYHQGVGMWGHDQQLYYAWLRSPMIDGDVDFSNEYNDYDISHSLSPLVKNQRLSNGLIGNPTGIGCALLWLPFFCLGLLLSWVGGLPPDGYNPIFQVVIPMGSIFYGYLALCFTYRICRLEFSRRASVLSTAGMFLGTTVAYVFMSLPTLSHLPAMAVLGACLLVAMRNRHKPPTLRLQVLLGALLGLLIMVRIPMAIMAVVLVPVALGRVVAAGRGRRWIAARRELLGGVVAAGAMFLTLIPQFIAWNALFGKPFVSSYGDPSAVLNPLCPHLLEALFSCFHGLISWTPLAGIAIVGLLGVLLCRPGISMPLFVSLAALTYLVGCTSWWHFQECYGNRGFMEATPALAFGLAFLWQRFWRTGLVATGLLVLQNHLLIWAWNSAVLDTSNYQDLFLAPVRMLVHLVQKIL